MSTARRGKVLAWQGTVCPDHFVRTKVRPLFVEWDADEGDGRDAGCSGAPGDWTLTATTMPAIMRRTGAELARDAAPNPTVVLVPGVGMFSFGRSKAEARITGEFYINAIHVMEGATALNDLPATVRHPCRPGSR